MDKGEGIYLYDIDGNEYIDCASATFNLSLGYSHPAVVKAMKDQADKLIHVTSSFQTEPINQLARKLVDLAPNRITKAHLKVSGGSVANEGAIKMAQRATGKRDVISLFRSHLGQTMMTANLSGNAFRKANFPLAIPGGLQVPDPYCFRCFYGQDSSSCNMMCVSRLDDFLEFASSGSVAAILVEPISGNGGNIVPPHGYFQKLRAFCDTHNIKLIFDEIQTGIGRTGYMFAAEYFEVEPDAITVAKGLGGSGAQVAGILASDELSGLSSSDHSFTYGSNILAASAALTTLDIISKPAFLKNVQETGAHILSRLERMKEKFAFVGDVRGVGLMIGIEIVDEKGKPDTILTNWLAEKAMEHGLILRTSRYGYGNVLKIRPPLILTLEEAEVICYKFESLLEEVMSV
ncbi:aspartate aminotransferase family protein [Fictibacillus nanhaiensis]|uniref:Aspartate aminotransferase family protein n=2 Tax=Fictibacillus nanhaiensis TaxID=742169 RepID=A0ABS2ZMC2_9BACL|nr:aspartate aminotransferase family protein [Fictibacillus nanhaiensis]